METLMRKEIRRISYQIEPQYPAYIAYDSDG